MNTGREQAENRQRTGKWHRASEEQLVGALGKKRHFYHFYSGRSWAVLLGTALCVRSPEAQQKKNTQRKISCGRRNLFPFEERKQIRHRDILYNGRWAVVEKETPHKKWGVGGGGGRLQLLGIPSEFQQDILFTWRQEKATNVR